jgi:hypothetical protein
MRNGAFSLAQEYAARGWRVVPNHGITEDGRCTCGRHECGSPGKHPRFSEWASKATNDPLIIEEWSEQFPCSNIGLLLGPASGIVDIESDSEEGARVADELIPPDVITPTFRSSRGLHRLFRYPSHLSLPQKVVHRGLEIRLGGGGSSTQSIAPPSRHYSGTQYEWLPGRSPQDCDPADLPPQILELIFERESNVSEPTSRKSDSRVVRSTIFSGDRNEALFAFARRQAMAIKDVSEQEIADLSTIIHALNQTQCKPPLPHSEVEQIVQSAVASRHKAEVKVLDGLGFSIQQIGGQVHPSPGGVELTIYKSDPVEFHLRADEWAPHITSGDGTIVLTAAEFESPKQVATAVLAQTGVICLDLTPGWWERAWNGSAATQKSPAIIGLKRQLIDQAVREGRVIVASPLDSRRIEMLSWVVEKLDTALPTADDNSVQATGVPQWREDGSVWFAWNDLVEDLERQHTFGPSEKKRLKKAVDDLVGGRLPATQVRFLGGSSKYFSHLSREQITALKNAVYAGATSPLVEISARSLPPAPAATPLPPAASTGIQSLFAAADDGDKPNLGPYANPF